jgi:hypothetical protein
MNSSTAGKAVAGLLFTGLAAYSAYTWRRLSARASSSSGPAPPPLLSRAAYLALLQEVSVEAEAAVRAVEEASRSLSGREAAVVGAARGGAAAALLRADLARISAAAAARAGASAADVDAAHAYYCPQDGSGVSAAEAAEDDVGAPGGAGAASREVAEAVRALRARLGRHVLTRRTAIATIEAAHGAQAAAAAAMVEGALGMAGGDPQSENFQLALQHLSQRVAGEACLQEAGVGLQELMAYATREAGADAGFRRAFESVVETCGAQVQMALNAALMEVLQGGGGGH